jgi:hypothetical protein
MSPFFNDTSSCHSKVETGTDSGRLVRVTGGSVEGQFPAPDISRRQSDSAEWH